MIVQGEINKFSSHFGGQANAGMNGMHSLFSTLAI